VAIGGFVLQTSCYYCHEAMKMHAMQIRDAFFCIRATLFMFAVLHQLAEVCIL